MHPKIRNLRWRLKSLIERLLGVQIFRILPRGLEICNDLKLLAPDYRPQTIFDVDANVGQTASYFRSEFPHAQIYCFEPTPETFSKLNDLASTLGNVQCENMGMGSQEAELPFLAQGTSTLNRLLSELDATGRQDVTRVKVSTVDAYCQRAGISHLHYLKIDTEGHDKEVILGSQRMLKEQKIDFLQVEVSCSPENTLHTPFAGVVQLMESTGYRIFGFYSQTHEWIGGKIALRRCDIVFCSPKVVSENPIRRLVS